jgi:Contact-dependent growth inhibition CdiA C-terminal domain
VANISDIVAQLGQSVTGLREVEAGVTAALMIADEVQAATVALDLHGRASELSAVIGQIEALTGQLRAAIDRAEQLVREANAVRGGPASGAGSSGVPVPLPGSPPSAPSLTSPSRKADPTARPEGNPEPINPRDKAQLQESLRLQNHSAQVLATAGYRVRQLEEVPRQVSPDYEIEGRRFDCFTPERHTSPDGVRSRLAKKVKAGQADRFVVNLDRSLLEPEDLRRQFARQRPSGMKEVLVIKGDLITRVWP